MSINALSKIVLHAEIFNLHYSFSGHYPHIEKLFLRHIERHHLTEGCSYLVNVMQCMYTKSISCTTGNSSLCNDIIR